MFDPVEFSDVNKEVEEVYMQFSRLLNEAKGIYFTVHT